LVSALEEAESALAEPESASALKEAKLESVLAELE
jgi:hypothetical protein